jgi:cysteinyl-tRNA synthetase
MRLRLYNTRSRTVEPFVPVEPDHVRIYVCGMTPSAEAHVGHARSFMFFDVLRRYLVQQGLKVTFVQNVTDVDDRSIRTAQDWGTTWREVIAKYFGSFKESMNRLHVLEPDHEPRATEYVPEIVSMIQELIARGHGYVAGDGVYYRVRSFPRYGELSHHNLDELMVGARIEPGEEKIDPLDFALWKFAKPGEPEWPSPWGAGRPGWHIECSAMSHALLGEPFDIHGGGFDLVFPHHENEIAQSEALLDRPPMARFWVHGGLLLYEGRKMSKSLGNFEPLSSLLDRHDPQAIRLLFLQTGYRKPMNFTEASITGATTALRRLYDAYDTFRAVPPEREGNEARERIGTFHDRFYAALDDDMNTSGALSVLFDAAAETAGIVAAGAAAAAAGFMHEAMGVLGISPNERKMPVRRPSDEAALPGDLSQRLASLVGDAVSLDGASPRAAVEALLVARAEAKERKDFALADRLRAALGEVGVSVTDTRDGTTWNVEG